MSEDDDRPSDADQPAPERAAPTPEPAPPSQPPVDRAIARLGGRLGGRSLSVYGILLAGAAVLLILLVIVWITADDGGGGDGPTCLNIRVDEANELLAAGEVERIEILYAQDNLEAGPVTLDLRTVGGGCRSLQPQGVEGQAEIHELVGHAYLRNVILEERQVDIETEGSEEFPAAFLWTQSPVPSATVEPTPTVPPPTVPPPTEPPASPTLAAPTATPSPPASPDPGPDASPAAASPDLLETATATIPPPA